MPVVSVGDRGAFRVVSFRAGEVAGSGSGQKLFRIDDARAEL